MTENLIQNQIGITVFLAVIVLISISNLFALKRLEDLGRSPFSPKVSILLPVRNEEINVLACLGTLLNQDYSDYEVIVIDDCSTDGTWELLNSIAAGYDKLKIFRGMPLPPGWLGKNWACHQLAQRATGDLLLFTDADTRHQPDTLSRAVNCINNTGVQMLSVLPRQELFTWAEKLSIPIIYWALMSFSPLLLAFRMRVPFLAFAIGQYMLFQAHAYRSIGGHDAIKGSVLDDIELTRRLVKAGWRWNLIDGSQSIQCRMYADFKHVHEGLAKNLFSVFGQNVALYLFIWIWIFIVFFQPVVLLSLIVTGVLHSDTMNALVIADMLLAFISWVIVAVRFSFIPHLCFTYYAVIITIEVIALSSMVKSLTRSNTWKGRRLT